MLFSCLSLNVFAQGAVATETEQVNFTEQETELTDAAKYQQYGIGLEGNYNLSAEQIATLVSAANILTNSAIVEDTRERIDPDASAYMGKYAGLAAGFYKVDQVGYETIKTVNDGNGNWYIKWDTTPADVTVNVSSSSERLEMDLGATKKLTRALTKHLKISLVLPMQSRLIL